MKGFEDFKIGGRIWLMCLEYEIVDIFVHYNPFEKEFLTKMVLKHGKIKETWEAKQVFKYLDK